MITASSGGNEGPASTARLWDIETNKEMGNFPVNEMIRGGLTVSGDFTHLRSDFGRLPFPHASQPPYSDNLLEGTQSCVYVDRQWIVQGFENPVWLPPAYRVDRGGCTAVQGETVMLGNWFVKVTFYKLILAIRPFIGNLLKEHHRD
jgi:hypothetical protein